MGVVSCRMCTEDFANVCVWVCVCANCGCVPPTQVGDIARAVENMIADPTTAGKTYELVG